MSDKHLSDLDTIIQNHINTLPIANLKDWFDKIVNSLNVEKIQLLNTSIDVEVELNETEKMISNIFKDIVLIDNPNQNDFQNNILDIKNFKMLNEMIQLDELKKTIQPYTEILTKNLQ
ncbi:hypothetical protein MG290_09650 [Flavobacterium sp. CBA20B-1]|uniref:hypothetical protein n=1 Tax=unclassified Flavobacterium TaxID=196869 RepID=UPI0022249E95|nr:MULTISPECIES: hypothetical protein [unclassified Flavobacterium]WCM41220.1 hypothetical protein MG290_09650 [Flavobacterium sp. CBA20B-1]